VKRLNLFIFSLLLLISALSQAQTTKEEVFKDITQAGGIYKSYSYTPTPGTPAPKGYQPFYISHYGRHGSRWLDPESYYTIPNTILKEAHQNKKLTEFGESLYTRIQVIAKDAEARYGALSPRGVREHKEIAERMFRSFPEVFSTANGRKCFIYSRSTTVPRCIISMAANNERLKELNPEIEIQREAYDRNTYLNNRNKNKTSEKDSITAQYTRFFYKHFDSNRFIAKVFNDTDYAKKQVSDPYTFISNIYSINADLQDIDYLNVSLADVFTNDELFALWQTINLRMYYYCGPSAAYGTDAINSAKLLLKNILEGADQAIQNGKVSADLRFGHDVFIIPLLALMDVKGMNGREADPEKVYQVWSDFKVSPMGVNLQLVFFRNNQTKDILVKILHCEKEVTIPVKTDIAPYYHWKDFKAYYEQKLAK